MKRVGEELDQVCDGAEEEKPDVKRMKTTATSSGAVVEEEISLIPSGCVRFFKRKEEKQAFEEEFKNGMDEIEKCLLEEMEMKDSVLKPVRILRSFGEKAVRNVLRGDQTKDQCDKDKVELYKSLATVSENLVNCPHWMRTMGSTQAAIVTYVTYDCLCYFFETGTLKSRKDFPKQTTDEYLLGVIRFVEELENYAIGRAMWQDLRSITICHEMTKQVFEVFSDFNFRNGQLRRRFDSLKYKVKKLATISYELSQILGPQAISDVQKQLEKKDLESYMINKNEFKKLVEEVDDYTNARDKVILEARIPQKESKKAIYALHRENLQEARKYLEQTLTSIRKTREETPADKQELITSGTFSDLLEEYAEARLYEYWLTNDQSIMSYQAFKKEVDLTQQVYLGALVDFTGELVRYGVAKATLRERENVESVLSTIMLIHDYIIQMQETLSGKMSKKLDAVESNTKKMENIYYELLLTLNSNRTPLFKTNE